MFLFKKQFAIFFLIFIGFLTLSGYFINNSLLNDFVDNKATQWYDIIAGFAAFLGVLNLVRLHTNKISYKKKNWQYSTLTLVGFFTMIIFGFIYKGTYAGDQYIDSNNNNKYDVAEKFNDLNSNNKFDYPEKYTDNNYGSISREECNEIENSIYNSTIAVCGNGKYDAGDEYTDKNYGSISKEKCDKIENSVYNFENQVCGNGKYDEGDDYTDSNQNNRYDTNEPYIDANYDAISKEECSYIENSVYNSENQVCGNGIYDPPVVRGVHLKDSGSSFYWMFKYVYTPLSSTMFALLAFFVASASYRAFRIRNFEATLLLVSGALLMIGRVPIGSLVPFWIVILIFLLLFFAVLAPFIKSRKIIFISFLSSFILLTIIIKGIYGSSTPSFLYIPAIQQWILDVPSTAGHRAILMGIALGTVAQSFRIITGRETSILGD